MEFFEARSRLTLTVNGLSPKRTKNLPYRIVLKQDSTDQGAGPSKVESLYPVNIRTFLKPAAGSSEQREKTAEQPAYLEAAIVAAFNLQEEIKPFIKTVNQSKNRTKK